MSEDQEKGFIASVGNSLLGCAGVLVGLVMMGFLNAMVGGGKPRGTLLGGCSTVPIPATKELGANE